MSKGIEFECDEARHMLRFDFNALCQMEEDFGCGISDIGGRLGATGVEPRAADIRMAFRAGLGPDYSLTDAGSIISAIGLARAMELIGKAMQAAQPEPPARSGGKGAPARGAGGKPKAGA